LTRFSKSGDQAAVVTPSLAMNSRHRILDVSTLRALGKQLAEP
jgi:hypothetical protein